MLLASKTNFNSSYISTTTNNDFNNNVNLNNSVYMSSLQSQLNNLSLNISQNSQSIPYISIEEFCNIVFNSVAFCICHNLNHDSYNFQNSKPMQLFSKLSTTYDHPENTELPPIKEGKKFTLVLDMDETLIHFFDVSNANILYI